MPLHIPAAKLGIGDHALLKTAPVHGFTQPIRPYEVVLAGPAVKLGARNGRGHGDLQDMWSQFLDETQRLPDGIRRLSGQPDDKVSLDYQAGFLGVAAEFSHSLGGDPLFDALEYVIVA